MRQPFLVGLCWLALAGPVAAQGAASPEPLLVPRIGETVQQFEARRRGLAAPAVAGAQASLAASQGHFFADATINGQKVRALVDTGASFVSLSPGDAERLGVKVAREDFTYRMSTANGVVAAAPVRLSEVQIGDVVLRDVAAIVGREGGPPVTLLGMSFLSRLRAFETSGGQLVLRQ
jgi:aspartyl protease family protein